MVAKRCQKHAILFWSVLLLCLAVEPVWSSKLLARRILQGSQPPPPGRPDDPDKGDWKEEEEQSSSHSGDTATAAPVVESEGMIDNQSGCPPPPNGSSQGGGPPPPPPPPPPQSGGGGGGGGGGNNPPPFPQLGGFSQIMEPSDGCEEPPRLPDDNGVAELHTIFCAVSIAVPREATRGERRQLRKFSQKRLLRYTAEVMNDILDQHNWLRIRNYFGEESSSSSSSTDDENDEEEQSSGSNGRKRKLEEGTSIHQFSALSYINLGRTTDEGETRWWEAAVAYKLVGTPSQRHHVETMMGNYTSSYVKNGMFLDMLRVKEPKAVAVVMPGNEIDLGNYTQPPPPPEIGFASFGEWDARRWTGFSIFSMTMLFSILLTTVARRRRKQLEERDLWGLATEKGVDNMLNFAWDGKMVYNKKKLGYQDDDSMLMGGFHQGAYNPDLGEPEKEAISLNEVPTGDAPTEPLASSGTGS